MSDNLMETIIDNQKTSWQLNALTQALGDLTLTVSDSLSIGRGTDNDVVLGSKEVSRNHALLSVLNDELYVKDLASSNGTFVNDERIESNNSTLLQANDTLSFASFSFAVRALEASETVETDTATATNINNGHDVNSEAQQDIEVLSTGTASDNAASTETSPAAPVVEEKVLASASLQDSDLENSPVISEDVNAQNASDQRPVVKTTIIDEILTASDSVISDSAVDDKVLMNDTANIISNQAAPMPIAAAMPTEPTTSMPSAAINQETVMSSEIPKQPLAEELPVQETTASESIARDTLANESLSGAPVTDEPLMHRQASHDESVVSPEHDKTTTTELQEEADPDVLRAKQAATSQFSGTANLGGGRDLGTTGNNAMDQALDNPATAGHADKKPSGGWFIWVFIALIIIGIALWLFNSGAV